MLHLILMILLVLDCVLGRMKSLRIEITDDFGIDRHFLMFNRLSDCLIKQ